MKYLGIALKNIDLTSENPYFMSASTYANALYTDSQKAMDDSDLYDVSSNLQGAKDEYHLAMAQANMVSVYANFGVEEYNNGNFVSSNSDVKQAIECVKSYNEHITKVAKLSNNYKPTKN
jgi:hypothetical protein